MDRRDFSVYLAGTAAWGMQAAQAQGLAGISDFDAGKGLKMALETGATAAVKLLGRHDGFLGNPQVRIPLPGYLKDAARLLSARPFIWAVEIGYFFVARNRNLFSKLMFRAH